MAGCEVSSTFDGSIQYGAFCSVAAAVFLYSESNVSRRIFYVGTCLLAGLSTVTSTFLIAFTIAVSTYGYDYILRHHAWRWKALVATLVTITIAIFMTRDDPFYFLVFHLTLDPTSGYFRLATWENAIGNIASSPLIGYSFVDYFGDPDNYWNRASVDSVWLVLALRFGLPVVIFMLLANLGSFFSFGKKSAHRSSDPYMISMQTGFTLAVMLMVFNGLTVHYWNGPWVFWALCVGIRASLKEYSLRSEQTRRAVTPIDSHRSLFGPPPSRVMFRKLRKQRQQVARRNPTAQRSWD